jgi:hypothetical protein
MGWIKFQSEMLFKFRQYRFDSALEKKTDIPIWNHCYHQDWNIEKKESYACVA